MLLLLGYDIHVGVCVCVCVKNPEVITDLFFCGGGGQGIAGLSSARDNTFLLLVPFTNWCLGNCFENLEIFITFILRQIAFSVFLCP